MKQPLYHTIFKIHNVLKNKTRPRMAVYGLSPGQPKVLRYLMHHDHWTQKQLADACDISAPTISTLLTRMEEMGLLIRTCDQADKRAGCISISEKGKQALDAWNKESYLIDDEGLQGFSEEEKANFADYLNRMYKNLTGKELN